MSISESKAENYADAVTYRLSKVIPVPWDQVFTLICDAYRHGYEQAQSDDIETLTKGK